MVRMGFLRSAALAALLLATPALAGAVTFAVNNTEDRPDASPGDGVCSWNPAVNPNIFPVCTLRAAIMEGNATAKNLPVSVRLAPGATYVLNEGRLDIYRQMEVGVPEDMARATIDANHSSGVFVFYADSDQNRLYGIVLTRAQVSDMGFGSAIHVLDGAKANFDSIDVHSNTDAAPGVGCAIEAHNATVVLRNSRIHHNGTAEAGVSGLCSSSSGASIVVIRSSIDQNIGTGVELQKGASLFLQSSTVADNASSGLYLRDSGGTIANSTIAGNAGKQINFHALNQDIKLDLFGSIVDGRETKLSACAIANLGTGEATLTAAWNIYSDSSCVSVTPDPHSIPNATLHLSELGDFDGPTPTRKPLAGSPAIDRAPASVCTPYTTDQRGLPRSVDLTGTADTPCDIGAVEVQRTTDLILVDNTDDLPDDAPGDGICSYDANLDHETVPVCTLRAAIMEANTIPMETTQSVGIQLEPGATYLLETPEPDNLQAAAGDLDITRRMDIGVPPDAARATVDANQLSRTFALHGDAAGSRLYGLEITRGFEPSGSGAAILAAGHVLLERLDVHGNTAGDLPGLDCAVDGSLDLLDSRVHHNGTSERPVDGVCGNGNDDVVITRSTIDHNTRDGIDVQNGSLFLQNSTVTANSAYGVYLRNAHAAISSSTISANNEVRQILSSAVDTDATLLLMNTIVDGSETNSSACGVYSSQPNQVTLLSGWNLFSDASCVIGTPDATSLHGAVANLSELGDFGGPTPTRVPLAGSDAIDRAPLGMCDDLGTDQRGLPRPVNIPGVDNAYCDTGAVELQEPADEPAPQEDPIFSDSFEDAG